MSSSMGVSSRLSEALGEGLGEALGECLMWSGVLMTEGADERTLLSRDSRSELLEVAMVDFWYWVEGNESDQGCELEK